MGIARDGSSPPPPHAHTRADTQASTCRRALIEKLQTWRVYCCCQTNGVSGALRERGCETINYRIHQSHQSRLSLTGWERWRAQSYKRKRWEKEKKRKNEVTFCRGFRIFIQCIHTESGLEERSESRCVMGDISCRLLLIQMFGEYLSLHHSAKYSLCPRTTLRF